MDNTKTYINILIDALEQKINVLEIILAVSKKQEQLINCVELDLDDFEKLMEIKQENINKINVIDTGFGHTYDRIGEKLSVKSIVYSEYIKKLKIKITEVSELGVAIQVLEERNKQNIQKHFTSKKNRVRNFKKSKKTVAKYYKNMNNAHNSQSYFLDKKK